MNSVPFDGIITLLIFLVGLPTLIVQFMPAEVRRIVYSRMVVPREVKFALFGATLVIFAAIAVASFGKLNDDVAQYIWEGMFTLLIVIILAVSYQTQDRYGRREKVIAGLEARVYKEVLEFGGRKKGPALKMMIELGKQSSPGNDRDLVLQAMKNVAENVCKLPDYQGDVLEELINGVVEILAARPEAEGLRNYKTAFELLTVILRPPSDSREPVKLIDQQQAVRALSELGQSVLLSFKLPTTLEYILAEYVQAFGRAAQTYPRLITDVTQALFEVGSVAVECRQYFFAVMALECLRAIAADPPRTVNEQQDLKFAIKLPLESYFDLVALMAHFWARGGSLREFVDARRKMVIENLPEGMNVETALEKAALHCKQTLKFTSADHLEAMRAAWVKMERAEGNSPL